MEYKERPIKNRKFNKGFRKLSEKKEESLCCQPDSDIRDDQRESSFEEFFKKISQLLESE